MCCPVFLQYVTIRTVIKSAVHCLLFCSVFCTVLDVLSYISVLFGLTAKISGLLAYSLSVFDTGPTRQALGCSRAHY